MINRGIVTIDDQRASIVAAKERSVGEAAKAMNITAERFWEAMEALRPGLSAQLRAFLEGLEDLGVYAEFRKSLILRWDSPDGKPINLGCIYTDGQVWTDQVNWIAPHELSHPYVEELAQAFNGEVEKQKFKGGGWHVRIDGKAPKIDAIVDRLEGWRAAIQRFVARMQDYVAEHPQ